MTYTLLCFKWEDGKVAHVQRFACLQLAYALDLRNWYRLSDGWGATVL